MRQNPADNPSPTTDDIPRYTTDTLAHHTGRRSRHCIHNSPCPTAKTNRPEQVLHR